MILHTSEEEIDQLDSGPTDPDLKLDLFPPDPRVPDAFQIKGFFKRTI